jgi:hypothetical protein
MAIFAKARCFAVVAHLVETYHINQFRRAPRALKETPTWIIVQPAGIHESFELNSVRKQTPPSDLVEKMVYNNEYILSALDPHAPVSAVASSSRPNVPHRYAPLPRTPVLSHDLPFTTALAEEAIRSSSMELTRQSAQLERERELAEILAEEEKVQARNELKESQGTWTKLIVGKRGKKGNDLPEEGKSRPFDKTPNAYELYAAIDRKDLKLVAPDSLWSPARD